MIAKCNGDGMWSRSIFKTFLKALGKAKIFDFESILGGAVAKMGCGVDF